MCLFLPRFHRELSPIECCKKVYSSTLQRPPYQRKKEVGVPVGVSEREFAARSSSCEDSRCVL